MHAPSVLLVAVALWLAPSAVLAKIERSRAAVATFRASSACPATGLHTGRCPGWEVDHVVPLCAGGPDTPENMQWLYVDDHRFKTKIDVRTCRLAKRQPS
ncbi:HNH endonuclease signature motif containing protein [Ideonella livida]|uniref:HNH endonuclease n=1 Tax=Ideonella livida TaxID=2707176 RepID=A0A7C9PEB4_9BURK|nr:HNH endonuclease signature motif containing protein [Ideonella livida]NDY89713.1 HNH endonuclease [Ideonella livida]